MTEHVSARVVLPSPPSSPEPENDENEEVSSDFLDSWPATTLELDLVHCRLGSLDPLQLPRFAQHLKRLCVRQNHISALEPLALSSLILLEELDVYDNKLKNSGITTLPASLITLDLSFNLLKHVPDVLESLPNLETVYFVQNRISRIEHLGMCTKLKSLELGGNRIRDITSLSSLTALEELWLGKNKITTIPPGALTPLTSLHILSLQSNRLTRITGMEGLVNLQELYLSHNGIEKLEGLQDNVGRSFPFNVDGLTDTQVNLSTLDIGNNFVPAIEGIDHLAQLEELWMNNNNIPASVLSSPFPDLPALRTIYLEGNPCQKADPVNYRRKVMLALPQVTQIDATYVKAA
ncbi:related to regulatory subunit of protein phosphatase-1 [Armillaria ostoyae]|uniref:Related to regulatory subunit of protein phosphatase-1 n=1 Tax=Armillaria ostoyae TaxID=47428 RepID=A0A284QUM1_ARMOS|nr:related to regulatory subunit of protein phosphatase-1 [Armillaria ostoyae]